jgi:hypothetical protein
VGSLFDFRVDIKDSYLKKATEAQRHRERSPLVSFLSDFWGHMMDTRIFPILAKPASNWARAHRENRGPKGNFMSLCLCTTYGQILVILNKKFRIEARSAELHELMTDD